MSQWLLSWRGALPVPLIITEPAVGYGGGLGLIYFHRKDGAGTEPAVAEPDHAPAPPSVSGVFAAATENGTKIGGAGHLGIWRNDTVRFTGGF